MDDDGRNIATVLGSYIINEPVNSQQFDVQSVCGASTSNNEVTLIKRLLLMENVEFVVKQIKHERGLSLQTFKLKHL